MKIKNNSQKNLLNAKLNQNNKLLILINGEKQLKIQTKIKINYILKIS